MVLLRQVLVLRKNVRLLKASEDLAAEVSRNAARFQALVQNASDVILLLDRQKRIAYRSG